jgi:hypothetical protein
MFTVKKITAICIILAFYSICANAQHTTQPLSNLNLTAVLPPAPNAFEITRYSGLPVSQSAGSVSATIPLGEVKAGKISVPISLSYNSGNGVLVNQVASRTGIGWVLNAGGVITRTVYNNPDESSHWITPPSESDMNGETQASYNYIDSATIATTGFDTQTDIFSFNFNGYHGQFYLNPTNKTQVIMISASNLKVVTNFHHEQTGDWTFMVIDPRGTKYCFGGTGATETSKTNPQGIYSACGKNFLLPIPNAWYLKSIQHYTGEIISFVYTACNLNYFSNISETIFGSQANSQNVCITQSCVAPNSTVCLSDLVTAGVKLQRIIGPFETVEFNYLDRPDIPGDYLLSEVDFYRKNVADNAVGAVYNTYGLNYATAGNSSYYNPYGNSSILSYRPFLTSVMRSASGMQTQTHTMSYYNMNGLPSRLSFAQDYWGYFNGVNNQHLVPPSTDPSIAALFPSGLANREPNGSYSYYGLLSKITYPTKGSDSLQYEPNMVYNAASGNYQVGGVRVAKNISIPLTGNPLTKKYVYAALTMQAQSSGKLRAQPRASDYYSTFTSGVACPGGDIGICGYSVAYSAPLTQLTYFSGGHIYYRNVIELQDTLWANGGIEHRYVLADPGRDAQLIRVNPIPGAPITNYDFPTGLEELRQTFVTAGHTGGSYQYTVVNKVATHYVIDSRLLRLQPNYVVRKNWQPVQQAPVSSTFDAYDIMGYKLVSQWIYPDTVTTTNYDLAGANPVTTYQRDVYADTTNLLLSERQTTGSDTIAQKITYSHPHEMVLAGSTVPYQAMINDNDIEPIIEQSYYKGNVFQQAIKTNYGDFGNNVYEPDSLQTKTTGSYDPRISFYSYTANGSLLSQSKLHGPPTGYLWGYQNLLPIAEAKNAAANEIYTQNFEFLTGAGVDTINEHTGKQGYSGAYTVSFSPPVGKSYVISWFQLNGSVWDYHREAYTGSKVFASGLYIDDIAVYPADAQLSMFTYDPVAGLTSGIDPKGETSYYEYDNYQRLMNVKDKDGNIVKHTDYHYQQ